MENSNGLSLSLFCFFLVSQVLLLSTWVATDCLTPFFFMYRNITSIHFTFDTIDSWGVEGTNYAVRTFNEYENGGKIAGDKTTLELEQIIT